MKVFIVNYNRLELPKKLAEWVAERGCEPIFIDNHSDYAPLLSYYVSCRYRVLRMKENFGSRVVWEQKVLNWFSITDEYIVTDSDLDLSGVPDDFVKVLKEGLRKYPQFFKCGLSLEIKNLPATELAVQVRELEQHYWDFPLDDMYFKADVDTTFAMYSRRTYDGTEEFLSGTRTNHPYTAKHVPWYYDNVENLSEDEQYYFKTADKSKTYWGNHISNKLNIGQ